MTPAQLRAARIATIIAAGWGWPAGTEAMAILAERLGISSDSVAYVSILFLFGCLPLLATVLALRSLSVRILLALSLVLPATALTAYLLRPQFRFDRFEELVFISTVAISFAPIGFLAVFVLANREGYSPSELLRLK